MGKRSSFERRPQDKYNTPAAAVELLPYLRPRTHFIEPCAGEGYLVGHLKRAGHILVGAYDLPDDACVKHYREVDDGYGDAAPIFITNPPWKRPVLHPLIENLSDQAPAWLLFDADWMHTKQAIPFRMRLKTIVSIGRVRWIEDSKNDGKDNCAWYLFDRPRLDNGTEFVGRTDPSGH
jgi:hypothetical protein